MSAPCPMASMEFQAAGAVMMICIVLALMSGIVGLCVACGRRPNKRGEALLFGIGLPIVFLSVAIAGYVAALRR